MDRHREGIQAAYEILSMKEPERKDVEDAIRAYHEKAFRRHDNAFVEGGPATRERYVGPWRDIPRD